MQHLFKNLKFVFCLALLLLQAFTPSFTLVFADETQDLKQSVEEIKSQAYALYNTGHNDEALKILNNLPSIGKDSDTYVIIANIYEDKKDLNKAIENLNSAIDADPTNYKAYYNLGCIFLSKKAWGLAEKNLELSTKHNKNFPWSFYNLGTLYLRQGKYSKAKKNLTEAILLKPDEKDFYLNLAYAYKFLGKEKESKKLLEIYNKNEKPNE